MLTAEDKLAIHELVSRYNRAIDRGDVEVWVATFTSDGIFEGVRGTFIGERQLRTFALDYLAKPEYEAYRGCQHWVNNIVIDGDADQALLWCDHILVKPTHEGFSIVLMASYNDGLRRTEGGWRFARRSVQLWTSGAARSETWSRTDHRTETT